MAYYRKGGLNEFRRDNLAGVSFDGPWRFALIPGAIIQWWMYMNPGRGFHGVAVSARVARSPIMTYVLSVVFWLGALVLAIVARAKFYGPPP